MNLNTPFLFLCHIINSIWITIKMSFVEFSFSYIFMHRIFICFFWSWIIIEHTYTQCFHFVRLHIEYQLIAWMCVCVILIDKQEIDGRQAFGRWDTAICLCWAKRTCGMCWRSIRRHVFDWRRSRSSDWRNIKRRRLKKVRIIHHLLPDIFRFRYVLFVLLLSTNSFSRLSLKKNP